MTGKQLKNAILQLAIQGKLVPPACRLAGKTRPTSQLPTEETGVWYVYVIECEDGSFYKGFTTNLQKRYKEHCSGRGAEWTKKHKPKQLYYYEIQYSEEAALKREKYLKSGSGREWFKREVVDKSEDWEPASALLAKIRKEKEQLVKAGKLKPACRQAGKKDLETTPINDEEKPFEIPESWEWVRVSQIMSVRGGKRVPLGSSWTELKTNHIYIRVTDMKNGTIVNHDLRYITEDVYEKIKSYTISKNDLYITVAGTIGAVGLVPDEFDGMNLTENADKLTDITIDKEYIVKCFNSPFIQSQFKALTNQMAQPKLSIRNILSLPFPLPPLAEQHRIVSKIEELMPLVEEYGVAQEKLDRLNEALPEALKKSILQQAIQGKLVPPACRLAGKTLPTSPLPSEETGIWYVYVIECEDGSFYKGFTVNLQKRYKEHCSGHGAEWTKKHKPKQLYYYEIQYSEEAALRREKYLKSGSGREWFKREVVDKSEDWEPAPALLARIRKEKEQLVKAGKIALSKPEKKFKEKLEYSFEIPNSWVWCSLYDVCRVFGRIGFRGYTKDDLVKSKEEGAITISPTNIINGELDFSICTYLSEDKYKESPEIMVEVGDILLVKTASCGKTALVNELPWKATINPQIALLKDIMINREYLSVLLKSPYIQSKIHDFTIGTSIPTFSQEIMLTLNIPLPPLSEQKRIVARVEELLAMVDGMK